MIWSMAETTHAVGAASMAEALYDTARPFGWLTVVDPGGIYLGSMEHHLGLLCLTIGELERADRHFASAIDAHRAAGATEWVTRSQARRESRPDLTAW